ncbi:MAG: hypothetical protein Q9175_003828 [Cornicularia normoerica]
MVGRPDGHAHMSQAEWAQIYQLNKDACPDPAQAIKFALLRVEAVKCGWLKEGDSNGIVRSPPPTQARYVATLNADLNVMKDQIQLAETAAFILPMVGEYVFRTLGHHYVRDRGLYASSLLYRSTLHWVNPGRAWDVLSAQKGTKTIPEALYDRYNGAPAKTTIITSTAAVIDSLTQTNLINQFAGHGKFDLKMITTLTEKIKADPPKYHQAYFAYGRAALTPAEKADVEIAKEEAVRFAPYS